MTYKLIVLSASLITAYHLIITEKYAWKFTNSHYLQKILSNCHSRYSKSVIGQLKKSLMDTFLHNVVLSVSVVQNIDQSVAERSNRIMQSMFCQMLQKSFAWEIIQNFKDSLHFINLKIICVFLGPTIEFVRFQQNRLFLVGKYVDTKSLCKSSGINN